jgi:Histidine kinase-, DNA gyrase B-, and HSP90-like ATPase
VPGYAGKFNQVWTNLVDNAIDAMEGMDGRGRLTVRTARDGDRVLVEIGDNGPGIPRPPPPTSWSPSPPPSRSARAPAWGSTSAGGSSPSAATATCASLTLRRQPLSGPAGPHP